MTISINYYKDPPQTYLMQQDNSPIKKRTKSQIQNYERSKQILPFIKPKYVKDQMFNHKKNNSYNPTYRSKSTSKHSEHSNTAKCQTEFDLASSHKKIENEGDEKYKIRFKLMDFYKQMEEAKAKEETEATEIEKEEQPKQTKKIHFSFLMRRKKHTNFANNKEEVISTSHDISSKQKIFYIPALLSKINEHKSKNQNEQSPQRLGKIRKQSSFINYGFQQQVMSKKLIKRQVNLIKVKKAFKKVGNAILFLLYLKRYNHRLQAKRRRFLEKVCPSNIQQRLLELKMYFSQKLLPFFEGASLKYDHIYHIMDKDSLQSKTQKLESLRRLMSLLVESISKGLNQIKGRTHLVQIIYIICKHGSFSCLWQCHTPEELDISCISPQIGYLCADKYLERSYIIGLIFVKIIIYNILLKPELANFSLTPLADRTKLYSNIKLVSNIFYELLISIQDNYLELADQKFKIGNWRNLTYKFDIRSSQSMTVKNGVYQQNQLISGLTGHNYLSETYRIDDMKMELKMVQELVVAAHHLIKEHHYRFRQGCF